MHKYVYTVYLLRIFTEKYQQLILKLDNEDKKRIGKV